MKTSQFLILFAVVFLSMSSCTRDTHYPISKLDAMIHVNMQDSLDTFFASNNKGMLALAVYLMDETNVLVDTTYYLSNNGNPLPNENTLFQLGSVTKVFTAAMIAQQVNRGALDLQTPVINYLPTDNPHLPNSFKGKAATITLGNLNAMASGLPRDAPSQGQDSMTYKDAFASLNSMDLLFKPGSACYLYSNLGFGIAGLVLSNQAYPNMTDYYNQYETVLIDSLLNPMGLPNTRITLDENQKKLRAKPYNHLKTRSSYWNPAWPMNYAAGGLYSSLTDMQQFAKNMIGEGTTLSQQDLDTLLHSRGFVWKDRCKKADSGSYSSHQAMAWKLYKDFTVKDKTVNRLAKDGGLTGTSTYITFSTPIINKKQYKGYAVLLVNRQGFPVQPLATNTLQQLFNLIPIEKE